MKIDEQILSKLRKSIERHSVSLMQIDKQIERLNIRRDQVADILDYLKKLNEELVVEGLAVSKP